MEAEIDNAFKVTFQYIMLYEIVMRKLDFCNMQKQKHRLLRGHCAVTARSLHS